MEKLDKILGKKRKNLTVDDWNYNLLPKINGMIGEIEIMKKQQIYKTSDNVKDYIEKEQKRNSLEQECCLECKWDIERDDYDYLRCVKCHDKNLFEPIQKPKEQKQSKLDEARNYKYASGEGWCSYQTMEYDIENIKQLYEQAIQELQCQVVDEANGVGKLNKRARYWFGRFDKLQKQLQEKEEIIKNMKMLCQICTKNNKIKVDEDIIELIENNLLDAREHNNNYVGFPVEIIQRLLSAIDKKEE